MDHPLKIELRDVSPDARDLECADLVFQFTDDSICKEWKAALMKARFTRLPKFAKSKVCILMLKKWPTFVIDHHPVQFTSIYAGS